MSRQTKEKRALQARRRRARAAVIKAEAKSVGCQICGYNKCLAALDFHHVGDKDNDVSELYSGAYTIAEINKCIVLCANCHREIHAK